MAKARRRHPGRVRYPRMAYYAWKMDETEKIVKGLRKRSEEGVPIVVEGRRDEQALRKLGVNGVVLCLKAAGESRFQFVDRLDGRDEVVLLTDFDREGEEMRLWLYQELSRRGVRSDDHFWRRVRSLARTEVRSVEELPRFLRSLEIRSRGERS